MRKYMKLRAKYAPAAVCRPWLASAVGSFGRSKCANGQINIPGRSLNKSRPLESGGLCLLVATFNISEMCWKGPPVCVCVCVCVCVEEPGFGFFRGRAGVSFHSAVSRRRLQLSPCFSTLTRPSVPFSVWLSVCRLLVLCVTCHRPLSFWPLKRFSSPPPTAHSPSVHEKKSDRAWAVVHKAPSAHSLRHDYCSASRLNQRIFPSEREAFHSFGGGEGGSSQKKKNSFNKSLVQWWKCQRYIHLLYSMSSICLYRQLSPGLC